jgi:hypothetical protein
VPAVQLRFLLLLLVVVVVVVVAPAVAGALGLTGLLELPTWAVRLVSAA